MALCWKSSPILNTSVWKRSLFRCTACISSSAISEKGDCLDLSTLEDTFYLYPLTRKNVVTKLQFAVEEIYKMKEKERVASRTSIARTIPESALAEERA